jgi:hypothetical protein
MSIPQNITRKHILQAMKRIDVEFVPGANMSRKYDLIHDGRKYPPKYTISLANVSPNKREHPVANFSGGGEANNFLIARDFKVCDKQGKSVTMEPVEEDEESSFPEGKATYLRHKRYERDSKIAKQAKRKRLQERKLLECDACGFCFQKKYGVRGAGFIEAHHTLPVSQLGARQRTKISDIALVCSNCHRMLHRDRPWLSINDLKAIIVKNKSGHPI